MKMIRAMIGKTAAADATQVQTVDQSSSFLAAFMSPLAALDFAYIKRITFKILVCYVKCIPQT